MVNYAAISPTGPDLTVVKDAKSGNTLFQFSPVQGKNVSGAKLRYSPILGEWIVDSNAP
jgi:hypothetical protein